jgi:hypothetical protein
VQFDKLFTSFGEGQPPHVLGAPTFALGKDVQAAFPSYMPVDEGKFLVKAATLDHLYAYSLELLENHFNLLKHVTLLLAV